MHMTSAFLIGCNLFPLAAFDPVLTERRTGALGIRSCVAVIFVRIAYQYCIGANKKAVAHMFNLTVNLQPIEQLSADTIESLASCGIGPLGRARDSRPAHIARCFERAGCI